MTIKTRIAPSPTGDLHVGTVRVALYNYLFAKHYHGQCYLRIEDTDTERSTQQACETIIEGFKWLNLTFDGDTIYQSQRLENYKNNINILLNKNLAYYCDCSIERLDNLRKTQLDRGEKPRYDRHCLSRQPEIIKNINNNINKKNNNIAIRFKTPKTGWTSFQDLVLGEIKIDHSELDDLVLMRSNGLPTYNFAVVIDDLEMGITHVIRGMDHLNNTPRQILIFQALGYAPPIYAHLPMIHGLDGKKLSKRDGATSVLAYRTLGYLPEALLNYLVRLGWSHGDQEIFSRDEMIALFNLTHISPSPAIFNLEKLQWLNHYYLKNHLKNNTLDQLINPLKYQFDIIKNNINLNTGPKLSDLLTVQVDRFKTLSEIADNSLYFYCDEIDYNPSMLSEFLTAPNCLILENFYNKLLILNNNDFTLENIKNILAEFLEEHRLKLGDLAQPLRVAITGSATSPAIDKTLFLLGKNKTLQRLKYLLKI